VSTPPASAPSGDRPPRTAAASSAAVTGSGSVTNGAHQGA
jgi:hypothetical protein